MAPRFLPGVRGSGDTIYRGRKRERAGVEGEVGKGGSSALPLWTGIGPAVRVCTSGETSVEVKSFTQSPHPQPRSPPLFTLRTGKMWESPLCLLFQAHSHFPLGSGNTIYCSQE